MFLLVILSFLLYFFCPPVYGAENEIMPFGEQKGFNFVIAVPETPGNSNSVHFSQAVSFFSEAEKNGKLPDARISVILSKNDYSRLPDTLRPATPEGAAGIISLLEQDSSGLVILILPEEEPGVTTVKCGVKYETSPPELLTAVVKAMDESGINWNLEENRLELYRIGWIRENHILSAYLNGGIPAVAICTGEDISSVLLRTVEILSTSKGTPVFSDHHYILLTIPEIMRTTLYKISRFVYRNINFPPDNRQTETGKDESFNGQIYPEGRFFLVGEGLLVAVVIFCSSVFLFYLCLLSFLHPETRRKKRKELLLVLPYPFLYSAFNIMALYAGEQTASFLFSVRFGKPDAWILLPRAAFFTKLSITFLLTASFTAIKNSFLFPRNPQILGYIAALSSFVNIFIFSVIEFSLAPYFILCFLFALICVYSKNKILQIIFTILYASVFLHFYIQIFQRNTAALSMLYNGTNGWNIWTAFFAVPIQLMISRIIINRSHTTGIAGKPPGSAFTMEIQLTRIFKTDKKLRIYIPVLPVFAFFLVLVSISTVFFARGWSDKKPLRITLDQSITDEGIHIKTDGPANPGKLRFKETINNNLPPFSDITPEDLLDVNFTSRMFLDRKVYELIVRPEIPARRIDVLISAPEGIAVQTASLPFKFEEGGSSALFTSGENPDVPLHVNFITGNTGTLYAEISFWSIENPYGFVIDQSDIITEPLLFVRHKITLTDGD